MLRSLTTFINKMTHELEENLNSLQNYKEILDESTIVTKTDYDGNITYANEAFCTITEYSHNEVIDQPPHSIVKHPPETSKETHQSMWNTIKAKMVWRGGILKNQTKSGGTIYLDTIILPLLDKDGDITEFMSIRHDMTKIIRQEQLINEQLTDNLTKLPPNRIKLFDDLETSDIGFLAIMNIDGFKGINDLYGFHVADQVLIKIASFISDRIRSNMTLYRTGGDEFAVTCTDCIVEIFKEKIISIVTDINKHVFHCDEYDVDVRLTAGIAYDTDRLLTSAEVALQNARKSGLILDIITRHSPEANMFRENTKWLKEVKNALATNNIINYFQPIQSLTNPDDVKYEALVRLRDSQGEIHSPFIFLPIIKQTSEYEELTRTVIFNVFEICCKNDNKYTINLAAQDLRNRSTIEYLKHILTINGIATE